MLRRILVIFVVLGLALSVWTAPAAARPQIHRFSFTGLFVNAAFSTIDETECIATDVFVGGMDGNVSMDGQPDASSEAFVDVSRFDFCTGEQLMAASGFTVLPEDELVIDQELNQATLDTTLVVEDFLSGDTFRLDVSVTWEGTGETSTQRSLSYFKSPNGRIFSFFVGSFREAVASGTVTAMDTNLTPEPSVFAQIANVTNGELAITPGP